MGAYSPAPVLTDELERRTLAEIVIPSAKEMPKRGMPYRGILFVGLMIGPEGPKLIEYNCRFGDPECQVLMLRLESDLLTLLDGMASGKLASLSVALKPVSAVGVVMASKGYPGDFEKGSAIRGIDAAGALPGAQVRVDVQVDLARPGPQQGHPDDGHQADHHESPEQAGVVGAFGGFRR